MYADWNSWRFVFENLATADGRQSCHQDLLLEVRSGSDASNWTISSRELLVGS
jgi:hypothetical protein